VLRGGVYSEPAAVCRFALSAGAWGAGGLDAGPATGCARRAGRTGTLCKVCRNLERLAEFPPRLAMKKALDSCQAMYYVIQGTWLKLRMNDYFDNWTVQVRKGLLDYCVLNALTEKERYGYELVKALVDVPGLGVTEGTLYPLLSRLRVQGLVQTRLEESSEGPARKYYTLSKEGRRALAFMEEYLDSLNVGAGLLRRKGGRT